MSIPYEDEVEIDFEIKLQGAEALVLFELLSRWSQDKAKPTPDAACFDSGAECIALHAVLGCLEKQLVAPFREEYGEIIERARVKLIGESPGYRTMRDVDPLPDAEA